MFKKKWKLAAHNNLFPVTVHPPWKRQCSLLSTKQHSNGGGSLLWHWHITPVTSVCDCCDGPRSQLLHPGDPNTGRQRSYARVGPSLSARGRWRGVGSASVGPSRTEWCSFRHQLNHREMPQGHYPQLQAQHRDATAIAIPGGCSGIISREATAQDCLGDPEPRVQDPSSYPYKHMLYIRGISRAEHG